MEDSRNTCRRQKVKEKKSDEGDRISNLPDSILHHIFSFINTDEAGRSSVLSKRWRDLWTSLPTLNFEYSYNTPEDKKEGIECLVDKVFILRDATNIQRFRFICPLPRISHPCSLAPLINTWIVSALRRSNLQELVLETWFDENCPLPTCLFNSCKSLTLLKVVSHYCENFFFRRIPDSACLPSLKTLSLKFIEFVDEYKVNKFFSSCPVLESLTIRDCWFRDININISSLSLKHLAIEDDFFVDFNIFSDSSVKLKTPNLISFRCKDYMMGTKYYLEDISSLIKVEICMIQGDEDELIMSADDQVKKKRHMLKFLGACHNVEDLTLSATILEEISYPNYFLESLPTGFRNLKCLKIDASFSGDCIRAITCLLKISPTIETLFINRRQVKLDSEADLLHDIVTYQGELSFPCLLDKLEHVEIRNAIGCGNELKFLENLLKNAKVLKKKVVYTSKKESPERGERMLEFTEKLSTFPKSSSNITILVI